MNKIVEHSEKLDLEFKDKFFRKLLKRHDGAKWQKGLTESFIAELDKIGYK